MPSPENGRRTAGPNGTCTPNHKNTPDGRSRSPDPIVARLRRHEALARHHADQASAALRELREAHGIDAEPPTHAPGAGPAPAGSRPLDAARQRLDAAQDRLRTAVSRVRI